MNKKSIVLSFITAGILAANQISIEQIVVNGVQEDAYFFVDDTNLSDAKNIQTFTSRSISTLSTHANMNPYTVIAFSPSVNFTPADAAGSNEPSFHDPIRIRGKSQTGPGGVFMINSMPVSSNPGGGKQMVDIQNIASIDLLKGYISVDKNLGFSSIIGKVNINILAPSKETKTTLLQSFGSDSFQRTFIRVDSGKIGDFRVFGSVSTLSNNKTKGAGDLERTNAMVGVSYNPNDTFQADIYAIKNSDEHHNYDSLTYQQTQDLERYFNKDYATIKPTTSNDINYYDWNKQDFDTTTVVANLKLQATLDDLVTFKPYYKKDKGEYWFSRENADVSKNRVINWDIDHEVYGAIAAYEHIFSPALKSKIGYSYHRQEPPGPASDQKKYAVVDGELVFNGYATLAKTDDHIIQSPFLEFSGKFERFNYSAGVQYQTFEVGAIKSYASDASTSSDYDTAITSAAFDPYSSVDTKTFKTYLPSLYLGYRATENSALYMDYSRTYGFDINLFSTYLNKRSNFVSKGVTLQELWDTLELETSDNIDFGAKINLGAVTLNPSLFVSFVKNKQANIYDSSYNVSYPANVGDAFGYGAEFSASGLIGENTEFLLGLSYNRYSYSQNFQSAAASTTDIKGNQLPDAPKYMAKTAISYYLGKWSFTPSIRYTSSRYGDVENTQKIDAFALVDMDISYKASSFMGSKNTIFRATATNITDEKYISTINAADNILAASTTASTYQTGAPFAIYFSANLKY